MEPADKFCSGVTDVMHTLSNEPSVGLYYVCEHIQRSVPALVADKVRVHEATDALRGAERDANFALDEIRASTSENTRHSLSEVARLAALAAAAVSHQAGSPQSKRRTSQQ
jgi:hypothetical protein